MTGYWAARSLTFSVTALQNFVSDSFRWLSLLTFLARSNASRLVCGIEGVVERRRFPLTTFTQQTLPINPFSALLPLCGPQLNGLYKANMFHIGTYPNSTPNATEYHPMPYTKATHAVIVFHQYRFSCVFQIRCIAISIEFKDFEPRVSSAGANVGWGRG